MVRSSSRRSSAFSKHQLPTTIHQRRFDHLIVRDTRVSLQDQRQRQQRGRNRRLPLRATLVDGRQLNLKLRGEELMAMASQKEKELRALDDFVFVRRSLDGRLPNGRSHSQIAS
jgi:transcription initiation factor TFIIIB Brf1 subunit/transcription initiation factor TFIIB